MYEESPNRTWLYPGDVIGDVELPSLNFDSFRLLPRDRNVKPFLVREIMSNKLFVYLSHECDFNDDKRQFYILCPLLNIDAGLRRNPDAFHRLTAANNIVDFPYYLNHFYYERREPELHNDMLIDFTRVISVTVNNRESLLKNKALELNAAARKQLKEKISFYFLHS